MAYGSVSVAITTQVTIASVMRINVIQDVVLVAIHLITMVAATTVFKMPLWTRGVIVSAMTTGGLQITMAIARPGKAHVTAFVLTVRDLIIPIVPSATTMPALQLKMVSQFANVILGGPEISVRSPLVAILAVMIQAALGRMMIRLAMLASYTHMSTRDHEYEMTIGEVLVT